MVYKSKYQGFFKPKNPEKYQGDVNNIVFRSLLERQLMLRLDNDPAVVAWSSETTVVPYFSDVDGKMHRYFVDFLAHIRQKNGNVIKYLIEVKPEKFCRPPNPPKNTKSKRFIEETLEYVKNRAKWLAAEEYAKKNGMFFKILTEKDIKG